MLKGTGPHIFAGLAALFILAGCESFEFSHGYSDIERTWHGAVVALPPMGPKAAILVTMDGPKMRSRVANYGKDIQLPTALYLHGCTGIRNFSFLERLAKAGFAVVAPDSLARKFRPLQCDPETKTGGFNRFVYEFRQTEIAFALNRLNKLNWVDSQNLFLLGTSEGGVAAALYRGHEFKARVITQWTCNGAPIVEGIGAPSHIPILSIVKEGDPWYGIDRTLGQQGHCGQFMSGRPRSESVVIRGEAQHDVFDSPINVDAIVSFLLEQKNN